MGVACPGLNGDPAFQHSEAFSFQLATDDQAAAKRAFEAMMTMRKIDIAAIEAALAG